MESISLHSNSALDVTIIPNAFIDNYMPTANGAYVKVYLYLLRFLSSSHSSNLSITGIADDLDHTENDIIRALCYWEKVNVLTLTRNPSNQIVGIILNSLDNINNNIVSNNNMDMISHTNISPLNTNQSNLNNQVSNITNINSRHEQAPTLSDSINETYPSIVTADNKDIEFVLSIAEKYIERILTPHDEQLILYLYTKANFSVDLILELYEYCASMGKKNYKYIEAVADAWIKSGIDTVDKAKNNIQSFNSYYSVITKEFGITRTLGQSEKDIIDRWINSYSFDITIIKEACKRTLLTIQKPDFKYTERILASWYKNDVHSLDDVYEIDKNHTSKNYNVGSSRSSKNVQKLPKSTNRFNNFTQRNYSKEDFAELEKSFFS